MKVRGGTRIERVLQLRRRRRKLGACPGNRIFLDGESIV
jgi:hypothetical protein